MISIKYEFFFNIRFLCASDFQLREFFIENEVKLFNYRLLFCDFSKMHQIFQKAYEQSKEILHADNYILKSYEKVLKSLIFTFEQLQLIGEEITVIRGKNIFSVFFYNWLDILKSLHIFENDFLILHLYLESLKGLFL